MRTAKQFSVPLVNKPGRLAAVLAALGKEKVASLAFTVMSGGGRGTLRLVPDLSKVEEEIRRIPLKENASRGCPPGRLCLKSEDHWFPTTPYIWSGSKNSEKRSRNEIRVA